MKLFFHNSAEPHISGKADQIFMKILSQMYLRTRKSSFIFGSVVPHIWTLDPDLTEVYKFSVLSCVIEVNKILLMFLFLCYSSSKLLVSLLIL